MSEYTNPNTITSPIETAKPELAVYSGMNQIFDCTQQHIDTMQDGDKITMSELTDKVAAIVKMPHSRVLNLISMFLQKNKQVKIETGRGGGIFKGKKMRRIDQRHRCHECGQVIRPKSTFNTFNDKETSKTTGVQSDTCNNTLPETCIPSSPIPQP